MNIFFIVIVLLVYPILQIIGGTEKVLWKSNKFIFLLLFYFFLFLVISKNNNLQISPHPNHIRYIFINVFIYFSLCIYSRTVELNVTFPKFKNKRELLLKVSLVTIFEELLYRGILLNTFLKEGIMYSYRNASYFVSAMFVIQHFYYFKPSIKYFKYYLYVFFVSELYNYTYACTGIIWIPISIHLLGNLLYLSDSLKKLQP